MGSDIDLILASSSPRRQELLAQLGYRFSVIAADIDESPLAQEPPVQHVQRLAKQKAQSVFLRSDQQLAVLASDTIVVLENEIFGKPTDFSDSQRMLRQLSETEHRVMTAISIHNSEYQITKLVTTRVTFTKISDAMIQDYWNTGEPQDKAGSYAIQGIGGRFVRRIAGSYSAVVGLPLVETAGLLESITLRA
ncbi:Maf family protein [Alginatibacterium sediminis]|uniref:Maf family protein n=1 Tax=Alginatibacterium sediminis TaxID=2164068 RepID=UPI0026AD8326